MQDIQDGRCETGGGTSAGAASLRSSSYRIITGFGLVSLLADFTYEGARSLAGPFLASLGAGAATVATVAGAGEFAGQGLRLVFGPLADRTGAYWTFTVLGYALNLLAVPLLALAGRWELAALLLILERVGKAIRAPARDALLAQATAHVGHGKGFGIHEALDQIGAVTGPVFLALGVFWSGSMRTGFALLGFPAVAAMAMLWTVRRRYIGLQNVGVPKLKTSSQRSSSLGALPRSFWFTVAGVACLSAGFADFALIAFHVERQALISVAWIPVFYALLMGCDGLAALILGRWFDRNPRLCLSFTALAAAAAPPFLFSGDLGSLAVGGLLWAVSLGGQESILRARVAQVVGETARGTAFGIFQALYGGAWFAGSAVLGLLYASSFPLFLAFGVTLPVVGAVVLAISPSRAA